MGMFGPKCPRCWDSMDTCTCNREDIENRSLKEENKRLKEENERLKSQMVKRK